MDTRQGTGHHLPPEPEVRHDGAPPSAEMNQRRTVQRNRLHRSSTRGISLGDLRITRETSIAFNRSTFLHERTGFFKDRSKLEEAKAQTIREEETSEDWKER
ncbi:hypothetical protein DY000_02040650 [Brassica cretica]|uniref:TPX2 C-terminal domain-containing protein n=1 Tax=Brassica cretica TaxID=69181 RepID=A0ABQ7BP67_BRACR|nr:hypothetical protein DY000_02040650 [Brassica cretica]